MNFGTPTRLFFTLSLCIIAGAQTARAQTIESMQSRLDEEVAQLDKTRDDALQTLRDQYISGLERRMETLDGENLELLREERDRAAGDAPLRPPALSSNPGVRHYQDLLVEQLDSIERPRAERLAVLVKNLEEFSEKQAAGLRNQGKTDAADAWEKWAAGLPGKYLDPRFAIGGKTRFFTMLESGMKPYLMIIGNSTSETPSAKIDAPWAQCSSGSRTNWPGYLSQRLQDLGDLRLGGTTCAGANSSQFLDGSGRMGNHGFKQLEWVIKENPDAVIIEFAPGADGVSRFNISVAESRANHEKIIRKLSAKNPRIEIFLWTGAKSFGKYGADRDGSGREVSNEPQEAYAKMYVDLADDSGSGVYSIDTFSQFSQILDKKGMNTYRTYFRDGNHTNQRGAEEIIVPEMLKVLEFGNP